MNSVLNLNIGHLNINSIPSKLADMYILLTQPNIFHIFGFTEARLDATHSDEDVEIAGFSVFRRDKQRPLQTGLAAYVHNSIINFTRRRQDLESESVECLWLEVKSNKSSPLLVGILYRHGDSTYPWYDDFQAMYDNIRSKHSGDILILGDFNLNLLKPCPSWDLAYSVLGLKMIINSPTRVTASSSTLIDHIYTNNKSKVLGTHVPEIGISDHYPVCCSWTLKLDKPLPKNQHTSIHYRSMKRFNKDAFLNDLHWTSFLSVFGCSDPDDALSEWYRIFISVLDKHAPIREKRIKHAQCPKWLTNEIRVAMEIRDDLRRSKSKNYPLYRKQRNHVKYLVREAQKQHFQKLMEGKKDIMSVWRAINTFTKPNRTQTCTNINAATFNNHFLTVAENVLQSSNVHSSPTVSNTLLEFCASKLNSRDSFCIPNISVYEVGKLLSQMKNTKSLGHDSINSVFLKMSLPYIVEPITYVLNLCIQSNHFPASWKVAKVIPLPKTKDLSDPNKFRPISLLPSLSKPFEKHVQKHLYQFFESHELLYDLQSGFRAKHSCHSALIHLINRWQTAINEEKMTGAVFLDFTKAFDLVNHELLLKKLSAYHVSSETVAFFKSYLDNRSQYVYINGKSSKEGIIKHGVPQGSILGPLLFSIYINDMPQHITNQLVKCSLFADDATLDFSAKDVGLINLNLQSSLDQVSDWCVNNFMVPNPSKTKCMLITSRQKHQNCPPPLSLHLQSHTIEQVASHRLLGITIDDELSWTLHTQAISKTVARNVYLLTKLKFFTDVPTRTLFFHAHIKPHLDYASCIWDGCSDANMKKVNSLHRRAAKMILPDKSLTTDEKLASLQLLPLKKSQLFNKCVMLRKALISRMPSYLTDLFHFAPKRPRRAARDDNNVLSVPWPRVDLFKQSFSYSGAKLWNSLPENITSAPSMKSFKARLHKHLLKS